QDAPLGPPKGPGRAGFLILSDLHLGKAERMARRSGALLPPYESRDTLLRAKAEIAALLPRHVVCLGDSFDDLGAAANLAESDAALLQGLQQRAHWTWIEGNHDPGTAGHGGDTRAEMVIGPLTFRHIAAAGAHGEISGHFHPKKRLIGRGRTVSRPCFLVDSQRVILPAFGTYTGGLLCSDPALSTLLDQDALAILTGPTPVSLPAFEGKQRLKAAKG
ncbi:MAG: ligase-associated DNA damage response endonuclease PdeM, partial [Pseudomonadota bacterium]